MPTLLLRDLIRIPSLYANRVPGMVERLVYLGPATQLVVRLANGEPLQALVQNQGQPIAWQQGTAIAVHLPADALRVLRESA